MSPRTTHVSGPPSTCEFPASQHSQVQQDHAWMSFAVLNQTYCCNPPTRVAAVCGMYPLYVLCRHFSTGHRDVARRWWATSPGKPASVASQKREPRRGEKSWISVSRLAGFCALSVLALRASFALPSHYLPHGTICTAARTRRRRPEIQR